jgi:hypothetical protein
VLLGAESLRAQQAGAISGVVLDGQSRAPVTNVLVRVADSELQAFTGRDGRFRLDSIPAGTLTLLFRHIAYGDHTRSVTLESASLLQLEIRITQQTIELTPVVVETLTSAEQQRLASGTAINEIRFEAIQQAVRQGQGLIDLLRQQIPNVRFRSAGGSRNCLEYRLQGTLEACRELTVVMDGTVVSDPGSLYPMLNLDDVERIEVLSPSEGSSRWGDLAAHGVLLIETRTGTLPVGRPGSELAARFDWTGESQPYPWLRVFTAAFLANAGTIAVAYLPMAHCTHVLTGSFRARLVDPSDATSPLECHAVISFGAGLTALALPGPIGGYAATRAGATSRSVGMRARAMTFGVFSNLLGQMVFFTGRSRGSDLHWLGLSLVLVGTPLLETLSDRYFRSLR